MFKRLVAVSAFILSSWWTYVYACGAPFGFNVTIPLQDIMVVHKGGVETYVFQPTFCGRPSGFGLILPVPSTLTAEPTLAGGALFDQLDTFTQPIVMQAPTCTPRGTGGGAGFDAGVGNADGGGTEIVAGGRVGFLDWVLLQADSAAAFTTWLRANGYPYDAGSANAFAYYVAKGWYFVAFRIAENADAGSCSALGPVALSFATRDAVVPARIAVAASPGSVDGGIDGGGAEVSLSWRVFAVTEAAQQLNFASRTGASALLGYSGSVVSADTPALSGLASDGDRLTKWTLRLDRTLTEDLTMTSGTARDYRQVQYVPWSCAEGGRGGVGGTGATSGTGGAGGTSGAGGTGPAGAGGSEVDASANGGTGPSDAGIADAAANEVARSTGCECGVGKTSGARDGLALLLVATALGAQRQRRGSRSARRQIEP